MKKLTVILLLAFPMLGAAEEYVTGCRADINLEADGAAIPLSTWTNGLVLWIDADAGSRNAGATNYFIPDLSTNANDATQTVLNSQPSTVITNGMRALYFDGVDDKLLLEPIPFESSDSVEIEVVAKPNWNMVGDSGAAQLYSHGYYGVLGILELSFRGSSSYKGVLFRVLNDSDAYVDVKPTVDQSAALSDGNFHTIRVVASPTNAVMYIDGVEVGSSAYSQWDIDTTGVAPNDRISGVADVVNTPAARSVTMLSLIVQRKP